MENKSHAFWAGIFAIGLTLAIALAVLWFNLDRAVRVPYDLISRTSVTGLTTDAAVRYRGLNVGKVQSIRFDPQHPGQIVIRILVDKSAPITHSTFGSLALQGVTGLAFVQLDDDGTDPTPVPSSSKHVAQLEMRPGLLDQLQQRGGALLNELQSVAARANAMLSPEMSAQLMATAESLQRTADAVTALARDAGPAAKALPSTVEQLHRTLASTDALMTALNSRSGPLYTNLDKIGGAADRAGAAVGRMDTSIEAMSARIEYDMLPRVVTLAGDVGGAARSIDRAAGVFSSSPSSVLFGVRPPAPGPGEAGFVWPGTAAAAH
ncbi:MlaD family protein [Trinickia caryophylli]|uniref:Phospholipid/cholesterol/gamma-HCH transport system substrate-binding protein n=1 Tax=Trinickia caryophylli TaxID=28094 RepID=A0A1X7ENH6_TRICW|nr:MlaD family protein [Trinickia caryophylli]PMS10262.1 MCE family protein [Trinickia caryophylli]TRX18732.1 MCE family protein [Trinickia caryophylli]WQE10472.1 MlaD family protein [Trinickia caryophylli]SMF37182.1 phospholipid/cholesterol/gamma-HCH transport system substrate-binding protein [Trinickia caryophylli]GLU32822.1 ABC transporter substrate-binding protein [Trinickia caryophylli]